MSTTLFRNFKQNFINNINIGNQFDIEDIIINIIKLNIKNITDIQLKKFILDLNNGCFFCIMVCFMTFILHRNQQIQYIDIIIAVFENKNNKYIDTARIIDKRKKEKYLYFNDNIYLNTMSNIPAINQVVINHVYKVIRLSILEKYLLSKLYVRYINI